MEPARSISKPPAFVAESNQVEVKVFVWMEGNLISCGSMFFENCGDLSLLKNWKKIKRFEFEAILRETWKKKKKKKKTSRFLFSRILTTNPLITIYSSIITYCRLFSSSESYNFVVLFLWLNVTCVYYFWTWKIEEFVLHGWINSLRLRARCWKPRLDWQEH